MSEPDGIGRYDQAGFHLFTRRPQSGPVLFCGTSGYDRSARKRTLETACAVTSLTAAQASPAQFAAIMRGHWLVEDSLHWIRDMTFGEDSCQVRTRNGPRVMASRRNLAITILRPAGHASIPAALRHHARRPSRPLQTIMHG